MFKRLAGGSTFDEPEYPSQASNPNDPGSPSLASPEADLCGPIPEDWTLAKFDTIPNPNSVAGPMFYVSIVNASALPMTLKHSWRDITRKVDPWRMETFWVKVQAGRSYQIIFMLGGKTQTARLMHHRDGLNSSNWDGGEATFRRWKSRYPERGLNFVVTFAFAE
ncbi:hypothetical protein RhiJN_02537 [Ceratobasidium sp. AG-Ba]|nr:hypothetical protein RhiJN_02537 [Ceratobasidium sp. AG-Ba]QRW03459.1 hypothetical protein RhiLY_02458 [Ceratobasidium sp. AG-Ba]